MAFAIAAVIAGSRYVARGAVAELRGARALVVLLILGGCFNFVLARVPATPTVLRVGEPAPDFTLPDATGAGGEPGVVP